MSPRQLSRLSDHGLVSSLEQLVRRERVRVVDILDHLDEVDRRRLYRDLGYSSLFTYCTGRLKFSESVAGRRIAAARVLRRAPGAREMLAAGEVSVTTLSLVAGLLTAENQSTLLCQIKGKSQRDVEAIVAAYRPERARRDRVRVVYVPAAPPQAPQAAPGAEGGAACGAEAGPPSNQSTPGTGSECASGATGAETAAPDGEAKTACDAAIDLPPTRVVRKHEIRFVAGESFMRLLEECRGLVATPKNLNPTLEEVFGAVMDVFLEKKSPVRRTRRREERQRAKENASATRVEEIAGVGGVPARKPLPAPGVVRAGDADERSVARSVSPRSRHIPAAVRDAVWVRDGGQCTWVGPLGERCGATRGLEFDHMHPFGIGGMHAEDNLRLLCRAHNGLAAEQVYGREVMSHVARRE